MKIHFEYLFEVNDDRVAPKVMIQINGVTMGPGAFLGCGSHFGGVDLHEHIGKHFEVEIHNGVHMISGVHDD